MKRMLCSVLAGLLLCASLPAFAAQEGQPETVTISFEELETRVREANPDLAALSQSYEEQRLTLRQMEKEHKEWMDSGLPISSYSSITIALQNEMKSLKQVLAYEEVELERAVRRQLYLAQCQYLNHFLLQQEISIAQLALDGANSAHTRLRGQYEAGYAPYARVEEAQLTVEAQTQALRRLEQLRSEGLTALAGTLGIVGELRLSDLPPLPLDEIPQRDYEADLAAYQLGAPLVRQRTLELEAAERAKKAYPGSDTAAARSAYQSAKKNLESAKQAAALEFPQVYAALQQQHQDTTSASNVAVAQRRCEAAQSQWSRGLIAKSQLEEAERTLETAHCTQRQHEIELYQAYLYYLLNLE